MNVRDVVKEIAGRIPTELRELRGKLMIEAVCGTLGVEEVPCPACSGTGWLDRRALEHCPLCCGFLEVPDALADWFNVRLSRARERQGTGREGRRRPARRAAASPPERYGRLADVRCRVHLPAIR